MFQNVARQFLLSSTVGTRRGRGGRRGGPCDVCGSAVMGVFLFVFGIALLGWNEQRSVRAYKVIQVCQGSYVEANCSELPTVAGTLVHASCSVIGATPLVDRTFTNVTAVALGITRTVEMRQWVETSLAKCDDCEPRYEYSLVWAEQPVSSDLFRDSSKQNPGVWPYVSASVSVRTASVGVFPLTGEWFDRATSCKSDDCSSSLPASGVLPLDQFEQMDDTHVQFAPSSSLSPAGTIRMSFRVANATEASFFGVWDGINVVPLERDGHSCHYFEWGIVSASEMFAAAADRNEFVTWALRAAGTASVSFGAFLPISAVGGALGSIPFIGAFAVAAAGVAGLACFVVGLAISLLVIGIAWLAVRPVVGGSVLVSSVLLGVGIACLVRRHHHHHHKNNTVARAVDGELNL